MLLRTPRPIAPLTAILLALLVTACVHAPDRRLPSGAPDPFSWNYQRESTPAVSLYYGEPNTDNVGLSFDCDGSGAILISETQDLEHAIDAEWDTQLRLRSGHVRTSYPARGRGSDFGDIVSAQTTSDDPLLKAFAASGRISVGSHELDAETPEDLSAIQAFFAACRPPR